MNRRNVLKSAGLILGYSLAAPAVIGILNGCKPEPKLPNWEPKFFQKTDLNVLKAFVDTIIPKTDTPSASEVGVVEFLDEMLNGCLGPDGQALYKAGLAKINSLAGDKSFDQLSEKRQAEIVGLLEKEGMEELKTKDSDEVFFRSIKGLVITGFMLSEKVGTEILAYDPIPGNYDGCIPLSQNGGRNWSI